jgi:hypothetical protein
MFVNAVFFCLQGKQWQPFTECVVLGTLAGYSYVQIIVKLCRPTSV